MQTRNEIIIIIYITYFMNRFTAAWDKGYESEFSPESPGLADGGKKHHIIAYDFGAKRNILRCLASAGCAGTVLPSGIITGPSDMPIDALKKDSNDCCSSAMSTSSPYIVF